jgi:hypothetical protein
MRLRTHTLPVGGHPLETRNGSPAYQRIAMNSHKSLTEFSLQGGERILDQVFPLTRSNGDVLELRLEVDHLLDRNQHQSAALVDREMAPRRRTRWGGSGRRQERVRQGAG